MAEIKKPQIDTGTPEGQYLELVSLESNLEKKVVLLEHFLTMFPAARADWVTWVYAEMQAMCLRTSQFDKGLAIGEKLLAAAPDDIDAARTNWRIAEKKGDSALAKKWSETTGAIGERVAKYSLPFDPEEAKAANLRLAAGGPAGNGAEREEFGKVLAIKDPVKRVEGLEALLRKQPQHPLHNELETAAFLACREVGNAEQSAAAAERIVAHNGSYDLAFLFIANYNFRREKDFKRAVSLASTFIEHLTAAKPEGVADEEWSRTKGQLGLAHYIIGSVHFKDSDWPAADRFLRAALPYGGEEQFRATILSQLGWVNYRMQNAAEALKFFRQCAEIGSPLQDQAAKAIGTVKAEYKLQ